MLSRMSDEAPSTRTVWAHLSERLRRFILARVDNEEVAADLLQDTFLRIHQRLDSVEDHDRLAAWVFRIARNVVTDHYRNRRRERDRPHVSIDAEPVVDDAGTGNRNDDVVGWLPELIDGLPEAYRDAVRLHELEGLSQQAVADRLGLSLSGAKSRVQRGREKLKTVLHRCCSFELAQRGNILDYERRTAGECCEVCDDSHDHPRPHPVR